MMFERIKKEAMTRGMKLLTNPQVMKMMADPRVMTALSRGFELKGQVQSTVDSRLKGVASALNLATKEDLNTLQSTLAKMESNLSSLEKKVDA